MEREATLLVLSQPPNVPVMSRWMKGQNHSEKCCFITVNSVRLCNLDGVCRSTWRFGTVRFNDVVKWSIRCGLDVWRATSCRYSRLSSIMDLCNGLQRLEFGQFRLLILKMFLRSPQGEKMTNYRIGTLVWDVQDAQKWYVWEAYRRRERMITNLDRKGLNQKSEVVSQRRTRYTQRSALKLHFCIWERKTFRNELMRRNHVLV
jgi:hypothetical protein